MPHKRPNEPIAPATIPGEPLDPRIPPDQTPEGDDDDEVGTDERGNEMLSANFVPAVGADRVPATDAEPEGSLDRVKPAALGIQDIETLEADAKGG
jgi:hypothetical protein